MVARMQVDLADLRAENRMLKTLRVPQVTSAPRQAAFTTTKVPRFDGITIWEQYKQVFDAIVSSNGWDNDTAVLQLFSHLEGDALNVALLVPLPRRLSRTGLVGALSAHYGSPGRLADYRRQFEKTTRTAGKTLHICHGPGDISRKGLWRYGTDGSVTVGPGSVRSGS